MFSWYNCTNVVMQGTTGVPESHSLTQNVLAIMLQFTVRSFLDVTNRNCKAGCTETTDWNGSMRIKTLAKFDP